MNKAIGVLALQGAFKEHIKAVKRIGHFPIEVRDKAQLSFLDGLIIPGGESTTISKLMVKYDFIDALKSFNKPIFGTCAGAILLAKKATNLEEPIIGLMDIEVERNAYGRQIDSFEADLNVSSLNAIFHGVFIRAPIIKKVNKCVEVLALYKGNPVLVRQDQYLISTFHPELTDDYRIHRFFIENVIKKNEVRSTKSEF